MKIKGKKRPTAAAVLWELCWMTRSRYVAVKTL